MLVSANILRRTGTIGTKENNSSEYISISIKVVLAHSQSSGVSGLLQYTMFDDRYWHRVKVLHRAAI